MATFITLTLANTENERFSGLPMRFPATIAYRKAVAGKEVGNGAGSVVFIGGDAFTVRETPEQIDALLGVTESDRARLVSLVDRVLTSPAALNRPWEWEEREAWISEAQKAVRAARGE